MKLSTHSGVVAKDTSDFEPSELESIPASLRESPPESPVSDAASQNNDHYHVKDREHNVCRTF